MDDEIEKLKKQVADLEEKLRGEKSQEEKKESQSLNEEELEEYSWDAPVRVFAKWGRDRKLTIILIAIVICSLLLYLQEYTALFTTIIFTVLCIALVTFPPANTTHSIKNKGILSFGKLYLWADLIDFWIALKNGAYVLHVRTRVGYPTQLFFVIPETSLREIVTVLSTHLKYMEIRSKQNFFGKISDGMYVKYGDIKSGKISPN